MKISNLILNFILFSDWKKIYFQNLNSTKSRFNICENEYWSCF